MSDMFSFSTAAPNVDRLDRSPKYVVDAAGGPRVARRLRSRLVAWISVVALCGCAEAGRVADPAEEHLIRALVGNVSAGHKNAKRFNTLFVEGSAPDAAGRARFEGYMTKLDGVTLDPTGQSAHADVAFEVLQSGEILGPVIWKLSKAGDEWKVSELAWPDLNPATP